jgi:hypothetical protein
MVLKLLKCENLTLSVWLKRLFVVAICGPLLLLYNIRPRKQEIISAWLSIKKMV